MLRVITYHRVDRPENNPRLDPKLISATPEVFRQHMQHISAAYDVISMPDLMAAVDGSPKLPRRPLLVTFDDAYCDFKTNAWPVMKEFGLPAAVFVPTAYPGDPHRSFWWDLLHNALMFSGRPRVELQSGETLALESAAERLSAFALLRQRVKGLPHETASQLVQEICDLCAAEPLDKTVLDWSELADLVGQGVTLGPHTQTHPIMTQLTPAQVREEVVGSRRDLRHEIGNVLPIFCYPNGSHDDEVVDVLREEGFRVAFTVLDGQNNLAKADLLRLKRTNITRKSTLPVFRLRLKFWFTYIDKWRHRDRGLNSQVQFST